MFVEVKNRIVKLLLIIVILVGLSLWVGFSSKKAAIRTRKFEPTAARVERGRYLVEGVAHCFECHSEVDWDKPGGQPKEGRKGSGTEFTKYGFPFLVAPNLTPDTETGAGTWTDEQLARAIREGIGHDGRRLFPVMPYKYFQHMSDEDLASVIVYLRSLEPVRNALPKTNLPESMKAGLPALQPIDEPVPSPDFSNPVTRGEYLVTLASCSSCHTPWKDGKPNPQLAFAGGTTFKGPWGEVNTANITPDPSGIGYYDEALFIKTLRTGHVGARPVSSIMPWGYFRNMTDEDLKAIFAYLRTLPPVKHRVDNTEAPTDCPVCGRRHGHGDMNQ
ncbi:MAG TPA: c-type cytochrome [Pyrinomonadaceae bacterium]|nr:c-type cytochrome [Pyrinomonadaceae bacterium]